MKKCDKNTA